MGSSCKIVIFFPEQYTVPSVLCSNLKQVTFFLLIEGFGSFFFFFEMLIVFFFLKKVDTVSMLLFTRTDWITIAKQILTYIL